MRALLVIPAAVLPLLPSATCPVCIAAYAGVLSSLGLGFVFNDRVQRPLILIMLSLCLASVTWTARRHRRSGLAVVALLGALAIIAGRVVWDAGILTYTGVGLLVIASVWNLVLRRAPQLVQMGVLAGQSTAG
jgi:hypothetical protein